MATNLSFANSLYLRFLGKNATTEQRQALTQDIAAKKLEDIAYTEFNATADFVNNKFDTHLSGDIAQYIMDYYTHFTQTPNIDALLSWANQDPSKPSNEVAELMGFMIYGVYAVSLNALPQTWDIILPTDSANSNENEPLNYTVTVTDTAPQSIEYSLGTNSNDDSAFFTIDSATGQLSFNQLPNFETKNNYNITVFATDTETAIDNFKPISITINDINELPQFPTATTVTVAENSTGSFYTAQAIDPERDTLTFTINAPTEKDNQLFNITTTGALSFISSPDFESEQNNYFVDITVSDGINIPVTQEIAITVTDVNEPPQLTATTSVTVAENSTGSFYTAQAIDPERDTLTFTINKPTEKDNQLFNITNAGALSFISSPDFESERNNYFVDITVSDGINIPVTQEINVTVTDINESPNPILTLSTINGNNALTVTEGGIAEYKIVLTNGTIAAGETLKFTVDALNGTGPFGAVNPDDFTNFIDLDTASYTFQHTFTERVSTGTTILAFSLATTDDDLAESQEQFAIQLTLASINESLTVDTSGSPLTTLIIDNDTNQSPIAIDDQFVTQSEQRLTNTVATNDNVGNIPSIFSALIQPAHGLLTLNADGSFEYTPAPEFTGTDSFNYQITDGDGETASANATIEVITNHIPLAINDNFSAIQNQAITLSVAHNDNLGDTPSLFSTTSQPTNGSLQFISDGSFTFTPATDFIGIDTFNYQITDANGDISTATAEIEVIIANHIPIAVDDQFATSSNQAINKNVAANDNPGDPPATFINTSNPSHGSLLFNNDGSFTYTPNTNYSGSDSFNYQITDADGETDTAGVAIDVMANNNMPIAVNDSFATNLGNPISNTVTANDSLGNTPTTFTNLTSPTNGSLLFNSDGSFTYSPNIGFSGTDSFNYKLTDADNETATATVTINIISGDDVPFANNDEFSVLLSNQTLNGSVAANDNLGDTPAVFTTLSSPTGDSFIFNNDGSFSYTSDFGTDTTTSFDYTITDADGDIDVGTAVINVVSSILPAANTFTTAMDTLTGNPSSDFYVADNTLTQVTSATDSVDGGTGTDYLIMTVDSANDIIFPGTVQNIEKLEISGSGKNLFEDVNFSPLTSVSFITLADFYINGSGNRTLTLGSGQALILENILEQGANGGDSLAIAQDNTQTTLNLTANELGQAGHEPEINLEGTGLTALNLSSTGTSSQFNLQQTATKLETINISGSQDITLTFNFFNASTSPTLNINTTNTASTESIIRFTNHVLNIVGGNGVDKFSIEDTDTFNGGGGTDTATFDVDVSAANLLDADLLNVEKIRVDGFNANTFDFSAQTEGLDIEVYVASGGSHEIGATILGSSDDDLIRGSFNNDTFTGGTGADTFGLGFFNTARVITSDTITDYNVDAGDAITADSAGYHQQNISSPFDTLSIVGASVDVDDTLAATAGLIIINNSSVHIKNALSLSTSDVATYLNSFEDGTGTDELVFENTNSIFYVVVSTGIDTGIYEADANGNGDTTIDANELTLIGTLTNITSAGSIFGSFIDFNNNAG